MDSGENERTSESDSDDDTSTPDGGWGWSVVFSAFVFNLITDGCSYSFGVLFTHLVDYFGASRSKTAWIGSVFNSAPLLCGPVASIVANRYGFRKAAVIGGVITVFGFFLSVFAPSVEILCVTYGVIAGFGISLPYLVSSVVVASYFRRKLTLASGLAECGAGVGTLVFAPLLDRLIYEYGWRGAILILSGIVGNIIVCGLIYRPLPKRTELGTKSACSDDNETFPVKYEKRSPISMDKNGIDEFEHLMIEDAKVQNVSSFKSSKVAAEKISCNGFVQCNTGDKCGSKCKLAVERRHSVPLAGSRHSMVSLTHKSSNSVCKTNFIDLSILLNWRYTMFAFSNFLLYFWYDVPYVFTVDRAVELGEKESDASLLVSVIGILHTVGNVVCGYIGDKDGVNRSCFYSISLWLCGAFLAFVPLSRQLVPTGALVGGYGLLSAASEALKTAIVVEIVGVSKLTNAYGVLMFLQGIANLIGPPVAGWLFDASGSYDHTFIAAGVSVFVAGILSIVSACVKQDEDEAE